VTAEEHQKNLEFRELMEKLGATRAAVLGAANDQRGVSGTTACPIDGGELRYSIAKSNGHIWCACSNPNCVRWME
jgi:hypothetical protein